MWDIKWQCVCVSAEHSVTLCLDLFAEPSGDEPLAGLMSEAGWTTWAATPDTTVIPLQL